jgi:hypothetical protein
MLMFYVLVVRTKFVVTILQSLVSASFVDKQLASENIPGHLAQLLLPLGLPRGPGN